MVTINTRKKHPATPTIEKLLRDAVSQASKKAIQLERGILVSFSQRIKPFDAICILHTLQQQTSEEYFFWEQPAKNIAIVGNGIADSIQTQGEERFTSTHIAWCHLLEHAIMVTPPKETSGALNATLLFGGFAFDVQTAHTSLWEGFPDGLLILPQLLLRQKGQHATCIINTIVRPGDDVEQCAQLLAQRLQQVHMLLEQEPAEGGQDGYTSSTQIAFQNVHPAGDWKTLVARTVQQIQHGVYKKVVLARAVKATVIEGKLDVSHVLARLKRNYPNASIFALQRGERCFVGATPEQLVSIQDGKFHTMALAGSAPRGTSEEEDANIGHELLESKKNKGEHHVVVSRIKQVLKNLCQNIWISDEPHLLKLKNVQHLITSIEGELLPDHNILELVANLHPTPAVGGLPLRPALQAIRDYEQMDRGWYASPLGWIDAHGNGEFVVALRSAILKTDEATLFAGCGIMADSDPEAEYIESCLKLEVMQRSLSQNNTLIKINDVPRETTSPTNATYTYVQAFVDELQRANVHNVVICPGSRSTPLAMTFASTPTIHSWIHVDERSAAFFAMGMAKKLQQPVAIICTSGTAAANFLPAIVEAKLSRIPLLVITADRPPELRDCGAPQAIDQNRIYGNFVKWYSELALPEANNAMLQYVRTIAQRAVATVQAVPAGPVHLNMPFREPLLPEPSTDRTAHSLEAQRPQAWQGRPGNRAYVTINDPLPGLPSIVRTFQLLQEMCQAKRGLIIVGQQNQPALATTLLALAQNLHFPILADPLSQLRNIKNDFILSSYDAFLRFPQVVNATEPDFILRIGAMPTSKPILLYLQQYASCPQVVIDGQMGWEEPTQLISELIHTDPAAFCQQLQSCLETLDFKRTHTEIAWSLMWQRLDQCTQSVLGTAIAEFPDLFEGRVFTELSDLLPEGATLYVGNSMPIRDMDTFLWCRDRELHILGNRGANGIDGLTSSALGASAVAPQGTPTVLVIGDLSFFHDLNGLLAASLHHLNLTIVLINNDGGGIFSFLPQAQYPEHFEQLFGVPTGLDFHHAGQLYGGQFHSADNWQQFRSNVRQSIATGGLHIVEIRTERTSNVNMHRHLWKMVSQEILSQLIVPV